MKHRTPLLYVSGEEADQKALIQFVEKGALPYHIYSAKTLSEAKEKLKGDAVEVIVSEYRLSEGTALDLVDYANRRPIILFTGDGDEVIASQALKKGIADYVVKHEELPYFEHLHKSIEQILSLKHMGKATADKVTRILVVEDDRLDQKAIEKVLKRNPFFQYTFASTIHEAKEKLEASTYSLVLLDASLPDGPSSELFGHIGKTPFIAVAGIGSEEYAARAYRAGASDYIVKDNEYFYLKLLPWTIEKALRQYHLNELKEDFVNTVSHELRTPISVLLIGSSNLKRELCGSLTDLQRKMVDILYSNAERVAHLVDNILDVSLLESGKTKMNIEMITIEEIIRDTVHNFDPLAEKEGKMITCEITEGIPKILGDAQMISRVITNLLSNAIRFATHRIVIKARGEKDAAQISVIDDGPGIPVEDHVRLFSKFGQLNRPRGGSGYKGTGLGLAICKQIIERHGGKIWIGALPQGGTQFHFLLPTQVRKETTVL